jgi:hypothetical protein
MDNVPSPEPPANVGQQTGADLEIPHWRRLLEGGQRFRSVYVGLLVGVAALIPIAVGTGAIFYLLQVTESPDCREAAWASDSSSTRLYCAEELASKENLGDLRAAIELVSSIPDEDPLRKTGDRHIEEWSQSILRLGEKAFQEGELEAAVQSARSIPLNSKAYPEAEKKIAAWETTWKKAEAIYEEAKRQIERKNWYDTLETARKLLALGNAYWETTKYQELMEDLRLAREDDQTGKMTDSRLPSEKDFFGSWKRKQEAEMGDRLAKAYDLAQKGNLDSLKSAVAQAQMVFFGTPRYDEAQRSIANWQRQIEILEDRPYLNRAIDLAKKGDGTSLQAAIDEANQISPGRALYGEAQDRVEQWNQRVQQQLQNQVQQQLQNQAPIPVSSPSIDPSSFPTHPQFSPPPKP